MSKIFVIPDIHGRSDLLDDLLGTLEGGHGLDLRGGDKLIFLGDMIDRGKDSKGVLEMVQATQLCYPDNVVVLAGNHEWLAIDACTKGYDAFQLWMWNGGDDTLDSFAPSMALSTKRLGRLPDEWVKWMAALPLYHEEPGFFFSHAPIAKEEFRGLRDRGQKFSKHDLTWTYVTGPEQDWSRTHDNGVVGVCGHIHALRQQDEKGNRIMKPRLYDHYIFTDAGAGCSPLAPLVAIEVKSREVIYAWPTEAQVTNS